MDKLTACSLDCYDACAVVYKEEKLKVLKGGHTQGFLCPHLNHYDKFETISQARYKGKKIALDEALIKLKELLKLSQKDEILHYRGSGNFGLMQEVTDHFFSSYGAILTDGTLCDGAGEAGIIKGRGSNKNMPLSEIAKSDVVIIWGRNPHTTSSHLLPLIKDKEIIVIDPVKTKIAKSADLNIQIKPHGDLYLAMILTGLLNKYNSCNEEYYKLIQTIETEAVLKDIGVTPGQLERVLEMIQNKKVAIVCGVGIQKYSDGADVMRAIDAFAVTLGLFGKEGCGVSYLGNSKEGITSPFNSKAKRVSKVNTEFSNYKTVFIQGANPLSQMPDSLRVKESISRVDNLVYFGLYENETSELADLIIPAKSFLYKDDVRTSYSHNAMMNMGKVRDNESGISEYDLSAYLCRGFDIKLESQKFYLKHFRSFSLEKPDGSLTIKDRETIPYINCF
ncbi:MAG: molybdopterin-dependent oxidoreductase, partial [Campylobacterota bacterium]